MPASFLACVRDIPEHRIAGMVSYRLDEMPLATLVGVLRGADDFDDAESIGSEFEGWLGRFPPFACGIAAARTFRRFFPACGCQGAGAGLRVLGGIASGGDRGRRAPRGQTIVLRMDQSHIDETNETPMVSVRLRKRAVPVAWRVRSGQGNIGFGVQQELLDSGYARLPKDCVRQAGRPPVLCNGQIDWLVSKGPPVLSHSLEEHLDACSRRRRIDHRRCRFAAAGRPHGGRTLWQRRRGRYWRAA